PPPPFGSDWEDDEDFDDDFPASGSHRAAVARRPVPARPPLRPWESKLHELQESMRSPEAAAVAGPEREVFYEIDAEGSREAGQIVVQSSQRQRRSNGQWGKLKPLKLKADRLHEIEREED